MPHIVKFPGSYGTGGGNYLDADLQTSWVVFFFEIKPKLIITTVRIYLARPTIHRLELLIPHLEIFVRE